MTSLYIHIPWCIRKCPYCDFNSHKSPDILPEKQYVSALIEDLSIDLNAFPKRALSSIFIGGGTPSLLNASAYQTLFEAIQKLLPFSADIEITLEANPGTVEGGRFHEYHALGINRLSLGIQSFNRKHLQKLGRIHGADEAHAAIETAQKAGFTNINLDLMHSLPEQTVEEGLDDLQKALAHGVAHLSWYQLTIEPNTVFYKQKPSLPSDEISHQLEKEGLQLLRAAGFQRYEISAFCKPKQAAKHNLNYWRFGDYYGIGAGAHGKISAFGQVIRTQKQRQPKDYLDGQKKYLAKKTILSQEDLIFEFMLNTTRLEEAIPYALLSTQTGLNPKLLEAKLAIAKEKGLVHLHPTAWQVSDFGRRFTNDLQALFLGV